MSLEQKISKTKKTLQLKSSKVQKPKAFVNSNRISSKRGWLYHAEVTVDEAHAMLTNE